MQRVGTIILPMMELISVTLSWKSLFVDTASDTSLGKIKDQTSAKAKGCIC